MIYFCTGFNYFIRVSDRKRMANMTVISYWRYNGWGLGLDNLTWWKSWAIFPFYLIWALLKPLAHCILKYIVNWNGWIGVLKHHVFFSNLYELFRGQLFCFLMNTTAIIWDCYIHTFKFSVKLTIWIEKQWHTPVN